MVDEIPMEASPEDVFEQRMEVAASAPDNDYAPSDSRATPPASVPWDADPADVAEQQAEVPLDDEDWS